jgi:hypothetical protein
MVCAGGRCRCQTRGSRCIQTQDCCSGTCSGGVCSA